MSRGLRALIIGGLQGQQQGRRDKEIREQEADEKAERERIRQERIRDRVLEIVGKTPEAFPDMQTPEQPRLPEIVAPRTVDEAAPRPMPRIGEQSPPLPTRAQAPVTTEEVAPERAGIWRQATERKSPLETMSEGQAVNQAVTYRQQRAQEKEARNRQAFTELEKSSKGLGAYDPTNDYGAELSKYLERRRVSDALMKTGNYTQEEADIYAETGQNVAAERAKMDKQRTDAEKAEAALNAPKPPVRGTPEYDALIRREAQIRAQTNAQYRAPPRAAAGESRDAAAKREATFVRARMRELMKPTREDDVTTPGLTMSDAIKQARTEWNLTEHALTEDTAPEPVEKPGAPVKPSQTGVDLKNPATLRAMYDKAAKQLRQEKKTPQQIEALLGKRP